MIVAVTVVAIALCTAFTVTVSVTVAVVVATIQTTVRLTLNIKTLTQWLFCGRCLFLDPFSQTQCLGCLFSFFLSGV